MLLLQYVSICGIDGVQGRRRLDLDRRPHLPNLQGNIQRRGAIGLHQDRRDFFRLESLMIDGNGVSPDRQVDKIVCSTSIRLLRARQLRLIAHDGHGCIRQHAAAFVDHGPRDSAESLLRQSGQAELKKDCQ